MCADAADVYVSAKLRVRLLDINPAGWTTQPLLFAAEELRSLAAAALQRQQGFLAAPHASERGCALMPVSQARGQQDAPDVQCGAARAPVAHGEHISASCADCTEDAHEHVVMRLVRTPMHIQAGAATAFGGPADLHMSLQGVAWSDVMSMLQSEARSADI